MSSWKFKLTPQEVPYVDTKYRKIKTRIPVEESLEIFNRLNVLESRSMHGQMPVVWDRAQGAQVYDAYGNCWIDFTSTIFVANAGHANPAIVEAIKSQLDHGLMHTYTFAHSIRAEFLEYLIKMVPAYLNKAFLLSAGTEATECALKLMQMYGQSKKKTKKNIISLTGAMHGRTLGAELLRGMPQSSPWIGYRDPNMFFLPFPYPWTQRDPGQENYDWARHCQEDIDRLQSQGMNLDDVAGIMIESYLGWGAIFYPKEYIKQLFCVAKKHDILVTFDDIQGGFGRTGKLFAYMHYDVEPDLVCLGKGMTGSLPMSGVIGRSEIMDLPDVGSMSSTHSANPLCCAAALANLKFIRDQNLVFESERKGKILHDFLRRLQNKYQSRISYVFGKGLVAALVFKNPQTGKPDIEFPSLVCELCMQRGLLLVHTGRESIKIGPPLVISDDALLEGLEVLAQAIDDVSKQI